METIYRVLLLLYPASYRHEYGAAMMETFSRRALDARNTGPLGRLRFVTREVVGLVASAARERVGRRQRTVPPGATPSFETRARRHRNALFGSELKHAARRVRRSPGFTLAAVSTLAIGIGGNAAIFTVVNSVVISPLPYPDPDRLVHIAADVEAVSAHGIEIPVGFYLGYRTAAERLDEIGLYQRTSVNVADDHAPELVEAIAATGSLFTVLAVPPALGRPIIETDEASGAPRVVVLSHGLWTRRYDGDPAIVGRTIRVDGLSVEVVGVMPRGFAFPDPDTRMWLPFTIDHASDPPLSFSYSCLGRLAEGVSLEDGLADLSRVTALLPEMFGNIQTDFLEEYGVSPALRRYKDVVVGSMADTLWLLLGSVGFVLLIACANVANLVLVRTETRRREIGVRTALGADRIDLLRYLLSESLAIGVLAGVAGLALAVAAVRLLVALGPADLPRLDEIGIGPVEVAFTVATTFVVSVALGLLPLLRLVRTHGPYQLGDAGSRATSTTSSRRATTALVVCQVSLALLLVVGGALFAQSFANLTRVDPGFDAANVLTFRISLPRPVYADDEQRARFHRRLIDGLEALPGVEVAGLSTCLPLEGWCGGDPVTSPDSPLPPEGFRKVVGVKPVSPDYFRALGMTLERGRSIEWRDDEVGAGAAVLSEALADRLFPNLDPIGKRIYPSEDGPEDAASWYTVVGVVGTVKRQQLDEEPAETVYTSMLGTDGRALTSLDSVTVAVRTEGDPAAWAPAVQEAVWAIDEDLPLAAVRPMTAILSRASARVAFTAVLIAIAAGAALLLGAVGIYGVVSHTVGRRTAEIGVRMAFGARRQAVLRMVLRQGLGVALVGVAIGLVGALVQARLVGALLYGVSASDPLTLLAAAGGLLAVAALASYLPARRAARIDPALALRDP